MVLIQFDIPESENKKLELFKIYNNLTDKRLALIQILKELDLKQVRDDFFTNNIEGGMV